MEIIFIKDWYRFNELKEKILVCEKDKSYFLLLEKTFYNTGKPINCIKGFNTETIPCDAWSIFKQNIPDDNFPLENRLVAFSVEKNLETILMENEHRFLPISKIRENNIDLILSED